jgi:hypothetical protein
VHPAVRGGEATLRELVHEYKTNGPAYRRTVQTTLRTSYTSHGNVVSSSARGGTRRRARSACEGRRGRVRVRWMSRRQRR